MSKKIAFIGAGSFGFHAQARKRPADVPGVCDATIALMDINPERLDYIKRAVDRIVEQGKYPAKVVATLDRKEALMARTA